jgi:hypothetical protein
MVGRGPTNALNLLPLPFSITDIAGLAAGPALSRMTQSGPGAVSRPRPFVRVGMADWSAAAVVDYCRGSKSPAGGSSCYIQSKLAGGGGGYGAR